MHPLYEEAKRLIPGGSNLYSKRAELHLPDGWPTYYREAKGIRITDLEGRTYRDFSGAGVGAAVLGWADPDVDAAVIRAIGAGSTSALLAPEEVELAKLLTLLHPWAGACRFTRSGGEAMAVAIRIAQAKTGRKNVYHVDSYHGWHVNSPLDGTRYLQYDVKDNLAAIIIEPGRLDAPDPEVLEMWRKRADSMGAVLIYDEISVGFRSRLGGAHLGFINNYNTAPDLAVFSKAMSNGYPMGAVVGRSEVMAAAESTFISSTAWSERIGPTAAIATIMKMWTEDVFEHTAYIGDLVRKSISYEAKRANVYVNVLGNSHITHVQFDSMRQQTLYTQLMLERGFLAGLDFYPTYAHQLEDCEDFAAACREVFPLMKEGGVLRSEVVHTGVPRK